MFNSDNIIYAALSHTHKQKRRHFHTKTTVHWQSTHGAGHIPLEILRFHSAIYRRCCHFFLLLVSLLHDQFQLFSTKPGHLSCSISDYFCNPTAADLIERAEDDRATMSAKKCNNLCIAKEKCSFFTFFMYRGKPSCYLLRSCTEKVNVCKCHDPGKGGP